MSDLPSPTLPVVASPESGGGSGAAATTASPSAGQSLPDPLLRRLLIAVVVLAVCVVVGLVLAWRAQQRVRTVEQELVARQLGAATQATEGRMLAQQAQERSREALAKTALLETRLAEVLAQRGQLDELLAAASRPRDDGLIGEVDAAIRMALQQGAVSGSAEPLVLALRQAEERLGRQRAPRLEPLRRAIGRDLERVRAVGSADMATLTAKVDEAIRMVDELPLLSAAGSTADEADRQPVAPRGGSAPRVASPAASAASWWPEWAHGDIWSAVAARVWGELRSLIRVTRINQPDAMLLAPEQAFFLRENLKLRLLNARLALLSRQFETARSDLLNAERWLQHYFDTSSRRAGLALDLLRQVAAQAHASSIVRPDDTLAALAAAAAAR